ncbi:MAG: hypothetical protein U9Q22_01325 [Candidatus Altiarchaeota archaeon]|nr:hypothetical protein [Candidatus Altiarchaeota archaeon]
MAKKIKKRVEKKSKEQKKRERYLFIMVFIVAGSMLFSGFYFFSSPGEKTQDREEKEKPYFQSYNINPIESDIPMLVRADEIKPELIAIVKSSCINFQTIEWIYNISMPGLENVVCEVAGPRGGQYYDLCGKDLLFFKFTFRDVDENTTEKLKNELDNRLDEYILKRAYAGTLSVNLSGAGTDSIYIPGNLDVKKGEYSRILLFQKSSDGSLFGLEIRRLPMGPVISTSVINLTDIRITGTIASDFYPNTIEEYINVTSIRINPLRIRINESISNETVEEITNLGVDVKTGVDKTEISFNSSLKDITGILGREGIKYSLVNGNILLRIPLNSSVEQVRKVLKENKILELVIKKNGLVKVPEEVLINGKAVRIEDADRFAVILDIKTNISDRINITLATLQFGDQEFVIGGSQTT